MTQFHSESRFPLLLARLLLGLGLGRARDLEPAKDAGDVIELPAAVRARRYLRAVQAAGLDTAPHERRDARAVACPAVGFDREVAATTTTRRAINSGQSLKPRDR